MSGPSFSNPLPACLSVEAIVVVSWFAWVRYGVSFQFRKNLQASERFRKEIRLPEAISGFKIKGQRQDMSRRSRRRYVTQLGNASPKNSFVQERPYPHIIARSSRDPGAKLIFSGAAAAPAYTPAMSCAFTRDWCPRTSRNSGLFGRKSLAHPSHLPWLPAMWLLADWVNG